MITWVWGSIIHHGRGVWWRRHVCHRAPEKYIEVGACQHADIPFKDVSQITCLSSTYTCALKLLLLQSPKDWDLAFDNRAFGDIHDSHRYKHYA